MAHILSIISTICMFVYVNQLIENGIDGTKATMLAFAMLTGIFAIIRYISKQ